MRSYTLPKISGTPDWSRIPVMPIDNLLWTDSIDITAKAQFCWDEEFIYVRQEAVEPNIRMVEADPLAEVCSDSCLEFFIQPTETERYINFEFNPLANSWIGYGLPDEYRVRLILSEDEDRFDPKVVFTEGGWVLTYRVPVAFLQTFFPTFAPAEGLRIRGNAYKCGDFTVKEHYLAWNRVENDIPAFHKPPYFGELIFGGEIL